MRGCTRLHRSKPREASGQLGPLQAPLFTRIFRLWAADLVLRTAQDKLCCVQVHTPGRRFHADAGLLRQRGGHAGQGPHGLRLPQAARPHADDLEHVGPILRRDCPGGARTRGTLEASIPSAAYRLNECLTVCSCSWTIGAMAGARIPCAAAHRSIWACVRQRPSLVVR